MRLTSETVGRVKVITVGVESLDVDSAQAFRREMGALLKGGKVVVDLEALRFVDSSGLGAILACLRQQNAAEGDLKICNIRPEVLATLQLVRMDRLLDIHVHREAALEAFGGAASGAVDPLGLGLG